MNSQEKITGHTLENSLSGSTLMILTDLEGTGLRILRQTGQAPADGIVLTEDRLFVKTGSGRFYHFY